MPAAFQSGNIMLFLFSDFRYLCIWHITFLCFGFEVDSFKFLITFFPGSFNNLLAMQSVRYSLNAQFSYFFIAPFVVKSKGCDKCVMFVGTMTHSMFSWSSFELTKYVACSLIFVKHWNLTFFSHLWCINIWWPGLNLMFLFHCLDVFRYILKRNLLEIWLLVTTYLFSLCIWVA